jgi:predicted nucleotidyltransferase
MSDVQIDQLIARLVETIGREYKPQKVILFGSFARGRPTEDSDIDLLIVKDTDVRMADRFVEVKRLIYDPQLRIPVSPLVYTPQELAERLDMGDDFVKEIVSEGKVLYEEKR